MITPMDTMDQTSQPTPTRQHDKTQKLTNNNARRTNPPKLASNRQHFWPRPYRNTTTNNCCSQNRAPLFLSLPLRPPPPVGASEDPRIMRVVQLLFVCLVAIGSTAGHPLCFVDDRSTDYDQVLTFCPAAQDGACCTDAEELAVKALFEDAGTLSDFCADLYKQVRATPVLHTCVYIHPRHGDVDLDRR